MTAFMLRSARVYATAWESNTSRAPDPQDGRDLQGRATYMDRWDGRSPPWHAWTKHGGNELLEQIRTGAAVLPLLVHGTEQARLCMGICFMV